MPRITRGILNGQDVVFRVGVSVENYVIPNLRNIKGPVHLGFVVTRYTVEFGTDRTNQTAKEIAGCQWVSARASDHGSASESEFQKREQLDVDLLAVDERIRNVRMSFKASEEVVHSHR